jgi:N-carbamoylputrescine amidase
MARIIRAGLIQASSTHDGDQDPQAIRVAMIEKHMKLIEQAAREGVQVLSLQELFYGPYFPAEQSMRWYGLTERVPDGPTVQLMMETAKRLGIVLVVPIYEVEGTGIYYNTAAVIDADGRFLGKYRKSHLPHCHPGFWEKFYFRPGNLGYPVFETAVGKVGVISATTAIFQKGRVALGSMVRKLFSIPRQRLRV